MPKTKISDCRRYSYEYIKRNCPKLQGVVDTWDEKLGVGEVNKICEGCIAGKNGA